MRESKSLDEYLQEIGKEELITAKEEAALAQRIRNGDKSALEKLTRENIRFVVSVAKQYQNQGLSLPELINAGNCGLIKAAENFDETRGFKFISYAMWHIKSSILEALSALPNHDPPAADIKEYIVRDFESVSATLTERESDVVKLFFGIGVQEMTLEEIGEKFGLSPQRVRQIREEAVLKIKSSYLEAHHENPVLDYREDDVMTRKNSKEFFIKTFLSIHGSSKKL